MLAHQAVGVEVLLLLRRLDRHCRSHNIAAECCVGSSGESRADFESELSKAGGRALRVKEFSLGSCFIESWWKMLSAGDGGDMASCTSEGAGVVASGLEYC